MICVDFGYTDVPVAELGPDRVVSHFDALFAAAAELLGAAPAARQRLDLPSLRGRKRSARGRGRLAQW